MKTPTSILEKKDDLEACLELAALAEVIQALDEWLDDLDKRMEALQRAKDEAGIKFHRLAKRLAKKAWYLQDLQRDAGRDELLAQLQDASDALKRANEEYEAEHPQLAEACQAFTKNRVF